MRRSGRTTRQADVYIQMLFEDGEVEVKDHQGSNNATEYLILIIGNRLGVEHNLFFGRQLELFKKSIGSSREHGEDKIEYTIRFKRKETKPVEELPDVEFVIPGMIHPVGFNLDDAEVVSATPPIKPAGNRFDKFRSK